MPSVAEARLPSVAEAYYGHHPDGCNCAAHSHKITFAHRISKPFDKLIELVVMNRTSKTRNALSDIYNADAKALNKDIFNIYNKDFTKALNSVFNDIDTNSPLWEKVQQFRLNAANFAAHKTYQLHQKLNDIKTEAKSEKDFINKAKPIAARFNQYQKTEYNTFVARCRTAKQWDTFQQEKHLFPNLTWIRTRSANPRELHLGYVGITLPINHPFWQTNQPGNLWNCKCDWKTTDDQPTDKPAKIIPPMPGLEGNPYHTGKIITDNHPYIKDVSESDRTQIDKFVIKQIRDENTKIALSELRNNNYSISVESKEYPLIFSRKGIMHLFHNTHKYQSLKDLSIPYLPIIIKNAELIEIKPSVDNPMVNRYLYYKYDILDKPAYINIRETTDGEMTIYAITPSIDRL